MTTYIIPIDILSIYHREIVKQLAFKLKHASSSSSSSSDSQPPHMPMSQEGILPLAHTRTLNHRTSTLLSEYEAFSMNFNFRDTMGPLYHSAMNRLTQSQVTTWRSVSDDSCRNVLYEMNIVHKKKSFSDLKRTVSWFQKTSRRLFPIPTPSLSCLSRCYHTTSPDLSRKLD